MTARKLDSAPPLPPIPRSMGTLEPPYRPGMKQPIGQYGFASENSEEMSKGGPVGGYGFLSTMARGDQSGPPPLPPPLPPPNSKSIMSLSSQSECNSDDDSDIDEYEETIGFEPLSLPGKGGKPELVFQPPSDSVVQASFSRLALERPPIKPPFQRNSPVPTPKWTHPADRPPMPLPGEAAREQSPPLPPTPPHPSKHTPLPPTPPHLPKQSTPLPPPPTHLPKQMPPPHPLKQMAPPHPPKQMALPHPPKQMAPPHPPKQMAAPHPPKQMAPPPPPPAKPTWDPPIPVPPKMAEHPAHADAPHHGKQRAPPPPPTTSKPGQPKFSPPPLPPGSRPLPSVTPQVEGGVPLAIPPRITRESSNAPQFESPRQAMPSASGGRHVDATPPAATSSDRLDHRQPSTSTPKATSELERLLNKRRDLNAAAEHSQPSSTDRHGRKKNEGKIPLTPPCSKVCACAWVCVCGVVCVYTYIL